jgi:hypothetical protein
LPVRDADNNNAKAKMGATSKQNKCRIHPNDPLLIDKQ